MLLLIQPPKSKYSIYRAFITVASQWAQICCSRTSFIYFISLVNLPSLRILFKFLIEVVICIFKHLSSISLSCEPHAAKSTVLPYRDLLQLSKQMKLFYGQMESIALFNKWWVLHHYRYFS